MTSSDGRRKHRGSPHTLAKVSDDQLLEDRGHMTLQEMGDKYSVSPSAVCHRLKKLGATKVRPRYDDLIPWRVAIPHSSASVLNGLRALGAYRAGKELSESDQRMCQRFVQQMVETNTIVEYDRETGFSCAQRHDNDPKTHPYYEDALVSTTVSQMSA